MVSSMTAYSQRESKNDWGTIIWEIRSVNQRFLEIYFRLPEQFHNLESKVRNRIRSCLTRGKIDCILHFEPNIPLQNELIFNKKLAKQLIKAARWIKSKSKEGEINPVDILSWPDVIEVKERNFEIIISEVIIAFEDTLQDFISTRKTEGQILSTLIEQRLKNIEIEVEKIRSYMPEIIKWQRERLIIRLENAMTHLDNNRLEQELILMAQRIDINEELERITVHVKEIYRILREKKTAIGRRLDFMMQELNRESNTLASKSINSNITNSAIELKVLIEQMREQIQNIE